MTPLQTITADMPADAPLPQAVPADVPVARLVKKHPLAIRWCHWINFPVLFAMIWSGTLILWANDVYPTEKFALKVPNRISFYRWGVAPIYGGDTRGEDYPAPEKDRFDIRLGSRLAEGMAWHFNLAWLFTLNGVLYTVFILVSGQWRHLVPRKESFVEAFKVVLHDVGLWKKPLPPGKYNHAQRIAYTSVLGMAMLMVITGLAIYKPAQLGWLAALLGGYQAARTEHFIITVLLVLFFFVHIAQVLRAGWNHMRAMMTGAEIERVGEAH